MPWLDRLKGAALAWIVASHLVERMLGCPSFANPHAKWPPLEQRIAELAPISGYGWLDGPVNVARWLAWPGDVGVALFLMATGFGLTWGLCARAEGARLNLGAFYLRRLERIYPMWLVVHALVGVLIFSGVIDEKPFRWALSALGVRLRPWHMYAIVPAWWFIPLLIQLYLVFPALWWALRRSVRLLVSIAIGALVLRGIGLFTFDRYLDAWSRGAVFVPRLAELVFGMLCAFALQRDFASLDGRLRAPGVALAAGAVALLGFCLSFTLGGMTVAPLLFGGGLFALAYPLLARDGNRVLNALAWVGHHSLSIFLVHGAAVVWLIPDAANPARLDTWVRVLIATVVTILGCAALEGLSNALVSRMRAALWSRQSSRLTYASPEGSATDEAPDDRPWRG